MEVVLGFGAPRVDAIMDVAAPPSQLLAPPPPRSVIELPADSAPPPPYLDASSPAAASAPNRAISLPAPPPNVFVRSVCLFTRSSCMSFCCWLTSASRVVRYNVTLLLCVEIALLRRVVEAGVREVESVDDMEDSEEGRIRRRGEDSFAARSARPE